MTREDQEIESATAEPVSASGTGSASQDRIRAMELAMKREMLSKGGEMAQAEAIARHYVATATTALNLFKIIEASRHKPMTDDTIGVIRFVADKLRAAHAHDLGIELSWPNAKLCHEEGEIKP